MAAVVTLDFARARKQVRNGSRTVTSLKAHAHARERRIVRDWLRTGDPDDPPTVRPVTGWDVW